MKKMTLVGGLALLFFAFGIEAQNTNDTRQEAQDTLRNDLNKNVIYGTFEVKRCVVSSRRREGYSSSFSTNPAAVYRTAIPADADATLSSGPGSDSYFAGSSMTMKFDLSRLDPNSVSIVSVPDHSRVRVTIAPVDRSQSGAISSIDKKIFDLPLAGVIVKEKAAKRIADEFRTAIKVCSK